MSSFVTRVRWQQHNKKTNTSSSVAEHIYIACLMLPTVQNAIDYHLKENSKFDQLISCWPLWPCVIIVPSLGISNSTRWEFCENIN